MKKNELNMIGGIAAAALFIGLFIAQIRFDAAKKKKWEDAENAKRQRQTDDRNLMEAKKREEEAEKEHDAKVKRAQEDEARWKKEEETRMAEILKKSDETSQTDYYATVPDFEQFKKPNPPKDKYKILLQTHGKYFIADDMQTKLGESRYHVIDDE